MDSYCSPSDYSSTLPLKHTHCLFSSLFGHSHSWCYLCFAWGLPPGWSFHLHHLVASELCCVPAGAVLRFPHPSPRGHGEAGPMALLGRAALFTPIKHLELGLKLHSFLASLPSFPASPIARLRSPRTIVLMSHLHKHSPPVILRESELGGHRNLNFSM